MAKIIIDPFTGEKHIPGCAFNLFETLCGVQELFTDPDETDVHLEQKQGIESDGIPDCEGCIRAAYDLFKAIKKKDLPKI